MTTLGRDKGGEGAMLWIGIIFVIFLTILLIPMIVGWAMAYLIHIATGEPEISTYWGRWIIGIAVLLIASVFKPDYYFMINRRMRGGGRDYCFDEYDDR